MKSRTTLRGTSDVTSPTVQKAIAQAAIAPDSDQLVQPVELPIRLFPPINWLNFDLINYVALPAQGAAASVIDTIIPAGYNGVIKKVACNFVGGGWTEGSGAIIWQILLDGAVPPGANSYNSIPASLGSPANPVEISGFRVGQNQHLQLIVQNLTVAQAGQLSGGRLVGYLYPVDEETDASWI